MTFKVRSLRARWWGLASVQKLYLPYQDSSSQKREHFHQTMFYQQSILQEIWKIDGSFAEWLYPQSGLHIKICDWIWKLCEITDGATLVDTVMLHTQVKSHHFVLQKTWGYMFYLIPSHILDEICVSKFIYQLCPCTGFFFLFPKPPSVHSSPSFRF